MSARTGTQHARCWLGDVMGKMGTTSNTLEKFLSMMFIDCFKSCFIDVTW